ncbi:ferritin-like domain-containing protein [Bacillus sp. B190/17]|uniref:Ferritin-like domain-containing protein n=1 Tax=Bacillus lumedeiriae TaxID=3058829 RepID=A0ABW8I9L1_9BACI
MYLPYGYPLRQYSPPQNSLSQGMDQHCLPSALERVKKAVQGEKEDELFYQHLIAMAPTQEAKDVIATIRDDERKHNQMFRLIYRSYTGQDIAPSEEETFQQPESYSEGLRTALFGELRAVENYRKIKQCLSGYVYQQMLFEIITDELKHATKYNYLFTLAKLGG